MLEQLLAKLGFLDKEAKIYMAALELGESPIQKLAHKAGVTRTGAYMHVRTLIKKGLMGQAIRDKKTLFYAEPPEKLLELAQDKKQEVSTLEHELGALIPDLRTLFETTSERPRMRFFEGQAGFQSMVEDFMKSKFESVEEFVPVDEAYRYLPPKQGDYRAKIKKKFAKIPMRIIYTHKDGPILKAKKGKKERRFIPKEKFPFTGSMTIYGRKVALMSKKKTLSGVIIENQEIAATLRTVFELAWDSLKP